MVVFYGRKVAACSLQNFCIHFAVLLHICCSVTAKLLQYYCKYMCSVTAKLLQYYCKYMCSVTANRLQRHCKKHAVSLQWEVSVYQ